jgi:hypothetical protein
MKSLRMAAGGDSHAGSDDEGVGDDGDSVVKVNSLIRV